MAHIIVIGAGLGGLPAALELRSTLSRQHRVTLVASSPQLEFMAANPWIAVGWRKCGAARCALQAALEALGIQLFAESVASIDAPAARLHLRGGAIISYDALVIATGTQGAPQAIPGFDLLGATHGLCTQQQAPHAWSEYQRLLSDPGPAIVAVVGSPRCAGPAYEFILMLDADLRARGLRTRIPLTLVTSEPSIGHMGIDGSRSAIRFMTQQLQQRQIEWLVDTQVVSIEPGQLAAVDCAVRDASKRHRVLPFKYAMMVPAIAALGAVKQVTGLCNPDGTVSIDRMQRARRHPNIFALTPAAVPELAMQSPRETYGHIGLLVDALLAQLGAGRAENRTGIAAARVDYAHRVQ